MHVPLKPNVDATGLRIGMAVSRYHAEVTESMRQAAADVFVRSGGNPRHLHAIATPGAWELTAVCRALAMLKTRSGGPALDALVAIGCVITGETPHDQYIAQSVTQGLTEITVQTGVPIGFAVLTCSTIEQARARAAAGDVDDGNKTTNKGAEAMIAAIETANAIKAAETSREFR